jgi:peroxiredoxin
MTENELKPKLQVGDNANSGSVYIINENGEHTRNTVLSIVEGVRSVIFGGPAPFSRLDTQQAKEYAENSDLLLKHVDRIYGIYCQDAFVMKQFGNHITNMVPPNKIVFHADGDAFWTRSQQLEFDFTNQGLSVRSVRYAMILNNGVIEYIAVDEPSEIKNTSVSKILEFLEKPTA